MRSMILYWLIVDIPDPVIEQPDVSGKKKVEEPYQSDSSSDGELCAIKPVTRRKRKLPYEDFRLFANFRS